MKKLFFLISGLICIINASAAVTDAEAVIKRNGYHSKNFGDKGDTPTYKYTFRESTSVLETRVDDVASLQKDPRLEKACESVIAGLRSQYAAQGRNTVTVSLSNHGYSGPNIACVFKYFEYGNVGTQVMWMKKSNNEMYIVIYVD